MTDSDERTAAARLATEQCAGLLTEYQALLDHALRESGQEAEPPAIMLQRAFGFGLRTIRAILPLLHGEEDQAIFACTLCRPYFEVAHQILWAARTPNGWQGLQVSWAKQDVTWAREAEAMPEVAEHARKILANRQQILERRDAGGQPFTPAPSMLDILHEIERQDVAEGLREETRGEAAFQYTNIYRILCRPAHGNMSAIGPLKPGAFLRHVVFGVGLATFALLRACCHLAAADPKKEIEAVGLRVIQILRNATSAASASTAGANQKPLETQP